MKKYRKFNKRNKFQKFRKMTFGEFQRHRKAVNRAFKVGCHFFNNIINFDLTPVKSEDMPKGTVHYFDHQ